MTAFFGPALVSYLLAMTKQDPSSSAKVMGLYRHAVKGLSADSAEVIVLGGAGECFPDDRRYALLRKERQQQKPFDASSPEWLHKQNFLCAFTNPKLMARYKSTYRISSSRVDDASSSHSSSSVLAPSTPRAIPCDDYYLPAVKSDEGTTPPAVQRLLSIEDRTTGQHLFGPADLASMAGRESLGTFFSEVSGQKVHCVMASGTKEKSSRAPTDDHTHQFGNTSSGVKAKGDTRTVHIINAETIKELQQTFFNDDDDGASSPHPILRPTRFRPNIVVSGVEPWEEFDWVGKRIQCGDVAMEVIKQTVRCEGVSIDPLDDPSVMVNLDIPGLLVKHYPQYGPYLGVYAVVEGPGTIKLGDTVQVLE